MNKQGKMMFKKKLLDSEDDIPKVFRTGLLKSDTASSLSRLMSEINHLILTKKNKKFKMKLLRESKRKDLIQDKLQLIV